MLEVLGEREVAKISSVVVENFFKVVKVGDLFQIVFDLFGISIGHGFNLQKFSIQTAGESHLLRERGRQNFFQSAEKLRRKIFGSAKEIRVSEDLPDCFFYEYDDVVVTVKDNFVVGIATYTAAVADDKGIRQGDSLDKVLAAYGAGGWPVATDDGATFYEYPFESEGEAFVMRLAVKNDVVEYISLRLDDAIKNFFADSAAR